MGAIISYSCFPFKDFDYGLKIWPGLLFVGSIVYSKSRYCHVTDM